MSATFTLATHAAAKLAGFEVDLDPTANPWLRNIQEWCLFAPGPHGMRLAKAPKDWLGMVQDAGFQSAYYGLENGLPNRTMGLLMDRPQERYFWDLHESIVSEGNKSWRRGWFMAEITPAKDPLPEWEIESLARELHEVIETAYAFALQYRETEILYLRSGLERARTLTAAILTGDEGVIPAEETRALYPKIGYGRKTILLGAALFEPYVFGGRGPWNDWSAPNSATEERRRRITESYYSVANRCVMAASMID